MERWLIKQPRQKTEQQRQGYFFKLNCGGGENGACPEEDGTTCLRPPSDTRTCLHFDGKEVGVWERLTLKDGAGINLCLASEEVR